MDFTQMVLELDQKTTEEAQISFREGRKNGGMLTVGRMIGAFRKTYFTDKACREGVPGLFRAVSAGMFYFLVYAKQWELTRGPRND